jgi:hypothetical protein
MSYSIRPRSVVVNTQIAVNSITAMTESAELTIGCVISPIYLARYMSSATYESKLSKLASAAIDEPAAGRWLLEWPSLISPRGCCVLIPP